MLRSLSTTVLSLSVMLVIAGCTGPQFVAVSGTSPLPLSAAKAACANETVFRRDCLHMHGWAQPGISETNTPILSVTPQPAIVGFGVSADGKTPSDISDEQVYCLSAVERKTGYRPILAHIGSPYTGLYANAELLDPVLPTPLEAALLAGYGEEADRCIGRMLQDMAQAAPRVSRILGRRAKEGKMISIELINRQITFAEAARRQHASIQAAKAAIETGEY